MTSNQVKYWSLREDQRHNLVSEKIQETQNEINKFKASIDKLSVDKKIDENMWKPIELTLNNISKLLPALLAALAAL